MRRARLMRDGLETMSGDDEQSCPSSVGRRATAPAPKTTRGEYDEFLAELLDDESAEIEAAECDRGSDTVAGPEPPADADRDIEGCVRVVAPRVAASVVVVLARR